MNQTVRGRDTRRLKLFVVVAAAVMMAALVAEPPALAATQGWTPTRSLGAHNNSWEANVAIDPAGDAVAVWVESDSAPYHVVAALRSAGTLRWGDPMVLSDATAWNPYYPMVAMDRRGDAFVVWYDNGRVYSALHRAGAHSWLATDQIGTRQPIALQVTPNGRASVLYGTGSAVMVMDRPKDGPWNAPVPVASGPHIGPSGLAMTRTGAAIVVYETWRPDANPEYNTDFVVHAVRRSSFTAKWGPDMVLTPPLEQRHGHAIDVGLDPVGDAVVVGRQLDGETTGLTLQVTTQSGTGGDWTAPMTLSQPGWSAGYPDLTVDNSGDVSIVWSSSTASRSVAAIVNGALPQGQWSAPLTLSKPGVRVNYPAISANIQGDAVVTWNVMDTSSGLFTVLQATERRGAEGPWSKPVTLSTAKQELSNAATAVDANGGAVAVWNESRPGWLGQNTHTSTYRP